MARKTFDVKFIKDKVNHMLANSTCGSTTRDGMIAVLTDILHESGNYHGFRHLLQHEIPKDHKPGICMGENGEMLPYPDRFNYCDDTRVHYY